MLNRYATAILGSLGTITVFTSYVAMYRNGTGAIYLGLLGFALIGSAMLVQRVNDLVCQVEDLTLEAEDLTVKAEGLTWQITHAQCVKGPLFCDGKGSCEWAEWGTNDGAFDA